MWSAIKTEETDYGHCLWLVNVISASSGNILLTVIYKNKLQMLLFDVEHEVGLLILLIAIHFYSDSIYLTDSKYRCYFLFYFLLSWTWWNNHLYRVSSRSAHRKLWKSSKSMDLCFNLLFSVSFKLFRSLQSAWSSVRNRHEPGQAN